MEIFHNCFSSSEENDFDGVFFPKRSTYRIGVDSEKYFLGNENFQAISHSTEFLLTDYSRSRTNLPDEAKT